MKKLYLSLSILAFLTAAFAAHSFAQEQSQPKNPSSQDDRAMAVSVVRTINTAEVAYLYGKDYGSAQARNRYATWSDLYASGILEEMKQSVPNLWSLMSAAGVRGYNLGLIVSSDGQSYELALHDTKPQSAGFSVFSDQSGLIYLGSPLQ